MVRARCRLSGIVARGASWAVARSLLSRHWLTALVCWVLAAGVQVDAPCFEAGGVGLTRGLGDQPQPGVQLLVVVPRNADHGAVTQEF